MSLVFIWEELRYSSKNIDHPFQLNIEKYKKKLDMMVSLA
jgi:hypothetical protein